MLKTFKIGDRVKIDEKYKSDRIWFTTEVYTIIEASESDIITIDRNLPHAANKINVGYLVLLKKDRKSKLEKIRNI
jgi:hypothetical protein